MEGTPGYSGNKAPEVGMRSGSQRGPQDGAPQDPVLGARVVRRREACSHVHAEATRGLAVLLCLSLGGSVVLGLRSGRQAVRGRCNFH